MDRRCPNCGATLDDFAQFCASCGGRVPGAGPPPPAPPVGPASPVRLTPAAAAAIQGFIRSEQLGPPVYVLVSASRESWGLKFLFDLGEEVPNPDKWVTGASQGLAVAVDGRFIDDLTGYEVDWVQGRTEQGFTFTRRG
jgi:Fe-S cluster assembly iron-binding protein IscA